jgi:energy-converting hydrogenase Eha subunit F
MAVPALAQDEQPLFHVRDPLAPRDEWGVLHQMPDVRTSDYAPRWGSRWYYYFRSRHELLRDPAYVAALQTVLKQNGYYCGAIDGVMSDAISEAIARAQKNHLQPVTGTLTVAMRRALHLP